MGILCLLPTTLMFNIPFLLISEREPELTPGQTNVNRVCEFRRYHGLMVEVWSATISGRRLCLRHQKSQPSLKLRRHPIDIAHLVRQRYHTRVGHENVTLRRDRHHITLADPNIFETIVAIDIGQDRPALAVRPDQGNQRLGDSSTVRLRNASRDRDCCGSWAEMNRQRKWPFEL